MLTQFFVLISMVGHTINPYNIKVSIMYDLSFCPSFCQSVSVGISFVFIGSCTYCESRKHNKNW